MIKGIVVIIIIFAFLMNPNKNNFSMLQCSRFKTGKYFYNAKLKSGIIRFNVIRTDSTQIEMNEKNEVLAEYSIRWIESCVYEMKLKKQIRQISPEELELKQKLVFTTNILSSTDKYYLFQTKANISNIVIADTIWVRK